MEVSPDLAADAEVVDLLEVIYQHYGYDFRGYALASMKRRLLSACASAGLADVTKLRERLLAAGTIEPLLKQLTVPTTEMFRDPAYFAALRETVVPWLKTFPSVKVWVAGCSTGEEAYSLAILFHEEQLLERTLIHATDINPAAIRQARRGIVPFSLEQGDMVRYSQAGGRGDLSAYFLRRSEGRELRADLLKRILFAEHNLATDGAFGAMQLISCRNVLIYFERPLKQRVLRLFHESLSHGSFFGLGARESIDSPHRIGFESADSVNKLYRRTQWRCQYARYAEYPAGR